MHGHWSYARNGSMCVMVLVLSAGVDSDHSLQDCQLLLQKHHLYWRAMVVPDLLRLEFSLVSLIRLICWAHNLTHVLQRLRVHVPSVLELVLHYRPRDRTGRLRPHSGYVLLSASHVCSPF